MSGMKRTAELPVLILVDPGRPATELHSPPAAERAAASLTPFCICGSVSEALAAAELLPPGPVRVSLAAGTYNEKVIVTRPKLVLCGPRPAEGQPPGAWIRYADWAGKSSAAGDLLGTFRSQTLAIEAPDCRLEYLGVANDFDYASNENLSPDDPLKKTGTQAVALRVDKAADRTVLRHCMFSGCQDTLFLDSGRVLLAHCAVSGHVDFVFGAATALFYHCRLVCLNRNARPAGWVCAPSTRHGQDWGLVFLECRIEAEAGLPPASFALGRPWHPSFAPDRKNSALFWNCWLGAHIQPEAWTWMESTPAGIRTRYYPQDADFAEYGSHGPGAARPEEASAVPGYGSTLSASGKWRPTLDPQKASQLTPQLILGAEMVADTLDS